MAPFVPSGRRGRPSPGSPSALVTYEASSFRHRRPHPGPFDAAWAVRVAKATTWAERSPGY
ncbi:hypothetical protein ABZS59_24645 [Streptomyces flaveolus]|uniref:hypothetical protein n=1 Tax=Streptomyces flaveolus TaxID=67297 RepID=UPI0033B7DD78